MTVKNYHVTFLYGVSHRILFPCLLVANVLLRVCSQLHKERSCCALSPHLAFLCGPTLRDPREDSLISATYNPTDSVSWFIRIKGCASIKTGFSKGRAFSVNEYCVTVQPGSWRSEEWQPSACFQVLSE